MNDSALPRQPLNCFASKMEKYCLENIIDNAPRHPLLFGYLHSNFKVAFLLPNTISLIQPKDEVIIAAFKATT